MATNVFASLTDIQSWLPSDKVPIDDANSGKQNIDATRIVKGSLAGMFAPIVIATWVDPDSTPELIRSVTGRLTAAFIYANLTSEEDPGKVSAYAQWLYDGAMLMLAQILAGTLTVIDDNGDPVDTQGSGLLSFFPDDTTTPEFTMDKLFS